MLGDKKVLRFALVLLAVTLTLCLSGGANFVHALTSTSTSLSCAPPTETIGTGAIVCTATVTGFTVSPNGDTITFSQNGGTGSVASATCSLSGSGSTSSCSASIPGTGVGSPGVQASFPQDSNNAASTSTVQTVTVTQAIVNGYASCAPSPVPVGASTICTVSITGYGTPGGSVTFVQNGGSAITSLAPPGQSCALQQGACSVSVATSGAGGAPFQAIYSGDTNNARNTFNGQPFSVSPLSSSTNVVCAPAALTAGQIATCTAAVAGYGPTGIVTWLSTDKGAFFSSNSCTLSAGTCKVSYTPITTGTITGTYSGDVNNAGSSGTATVTVNVNEMVQVTVANSGPSTMLGLSGCSVTPQSIPADGAPHAFQATSGCAPITVTLPSPSSNSRYLGTGAASSLIIGSCSSNSCGTFTATIYYQVQNTYQVTPKNPSSWGTTGTIRVNGTQLGSGGHTICSISVSTGAGQFSCQGWTDYNTQVVLGTLQVSQNQRWATSQSSFTDIAGGNQHNSNYFSQVLEGFQYSIAGSGSAPNAPVLNYSSFGAMSTSPLIGSASSVWLDSGSSWSLPSALPGSTSTERWDSSLNSGAATAGATVSFLYYHQYLVNFAFSVLGGGTAYVFPSITFTAFGTPAQGVQGWVDAGSAYNYTNPLQGSTSLERWFTSTPAGSVSGPGTLISSYYHQYSFLLSFGVVGGGVSSNPRLSYTSQGVDGVIQVTGTPATLWLDATTHWSITPLVPGSSASERWITQKTASGIVSAPVEELLSYYHQYLGTLSYSVKGAGGSPPTPHLNYSRFGSTLVTSMPKDPTGLWMDSSSAWNVPLLLLGAPGERWQSNVTGSVVASAPFTVDAQYTHQFFVQVGIGTPGGSVANTNNWHDQDSTVLLNATAAKLWTFAYWQGNTPFSYNGTTLLSNLIVTGPANETAIFFPGLTISADNLGSVAYTFGKTSGNVPAGSQAVIFPPPGRNVTVTATPGTVEIMFSGWTGALSNSELQSSVAIRSPASLHATFATDYNDIRTFAIAAIGVFVASAYVFIMKRGFTPKIRAPGRS